MSTPRPPSALVAARKRHATARERVESIDAEVSRLRGAIAAASRARESATASLRSGDGLAPALAQAVGEHVALSDVLSDEQEALAAALRSLTDAEAERESLERAHALACAAFAERDLAPRVVTALAALHDAAADLERATGPAVNSVRNATGSYGWMESDPTVPHLLHTAVRAAWESAAYRVAWKLRDMGLDDAAERVREAKS